MIDHPNDEPCPSDPHSAKAWRFKRGIGSGAAANRAQWKKYEAAMAEKRRLEKGEGHD